MACRTFHNYGGLITNSGSGPFVYDNTTSTGISGCQGTGNYRSKPSVGGGTKYRSLAKNGPIMPQAYYSAQNDGDSIKCSCNTSDTLGGMIIPDSAALNSALEMGEMEVKTSGALLNDMLSTPDGRKELAKGMASPVRRSGAEVGVGAGAKIKQQFNKSKNSVEDWQDKPAGVIRLYFVFQEEFEKYASAGFKNLEGTKEGYLENLPVGGK